MPGRGSKPPADLTNQIAVGLVVNPLLTVFFSPPFSTQTDSYNFIYFI
jgi:hypothetical protein